MTMVTCVSFLFLLVSSFYKKIMFIVSFIPFFLLLALHPSPLGGWIGCASSFFSLMQSFSSYNSSISLMFQISILLVVILSLKDFSKNYIFILMGSLIFYLTDSWLLFFISFEFTLIPVFYMVYLWSPAPERLRASWFLFIYTLIGSLPLFIVIFAVGKSSFWMFPSCVGLSLFSPAMISMAFLVKMPLYLTHSWLPKAHVEATVEGSVLLAGILLKFGSIGLVRSSSITAWLGLGLVEALIFSLSLTGSILGAMKALLKSDLKKVVAYSSVSHMNMSMIAFLTFKPLSIYGFFLGGIAHSLSASLMFIIVTLIYKSVGSRNILLIKNNLKLSSEIVLFTLICWAANMALPPFLGFISEFIYMKSILIYLPELFVLLLISMFLTSVYSSMNLSISALSWISQSSTYSISKMSWMLSMFTITFPAVIIILFINWLLFI
uniref:NADH-ubiquinone oxidoreductase chain 4 n=1 Tax=Pediculus schaeffi TaxID=240286 RepID=M4VSE9_PEDSC|nr:NADH dehydrogenase subunit 4 [Pediculus schaeffi]